MRALASIIVLCCTLVPVATTMTASRFSRFALASAGGGLPPAGATDAGSDGGAAVRTPLRPRAPMKVSSERTKRWAQAVMRSSAKNPSSPTPHIQGASELGDGTFAFVVQAELGLGAGGFFAVVDDRISPARVVASAPWPGIGTPRGAVRETELEGERVLIESDRAEGGGSTETTRCWIQRGRALVLLGELVTSSSSFESDTSDAGRSLPILVSMRAALEREERGTIVASETWTLSDATDLANPKQLRTAQREVRYVRAGDKLRRVGSNRSPFAGAR